MITTRQDFILAFQSSYIGFPGNIGEFRVHFGVQVGRPWHEAIGHMSYSLNSLRGTLIWDYMGGYRGH